jgi:DNA-binding transcriptional MerR regulator
MEKTLPAIPAKRYFTIGEVSELCGVKPYVLRYWEQEFTQLKPMKRRGNRRYYQHHEVLLIRRIRELLYEQGFTISGARNRLTDAAPARASADPRGAGAIAAPQTWFADQLIVRMSQLPVSRVSTINCVLTYFSGLPSSYSALEITHAVLLPLNVTFKGPRTGFTWLSNSMSAGRWFISYSARVSILPDSTKTASGAMRRIAAARSPEAMAP